MTDERLTLAFGETIRSLRKERGISQGSLARDAGIDRVYMSGLELGRHAPSLMTIYKLLAPLGISFAEFGRELDGRFP